MYAIQRIFLLDMCKYRAKAPFMGQYLLNCLFKMKLRKKTRLNNYLSNLSAALNCSAKSTEFTLFAGSAVGCDFFPFAIFPFPTYNTQYWLGHPCSGGLRHYINPKYVKGELI